MIPRFLSSALSFIILLMAPLILKEFVTWRVSSFEINVSSAKLRQKQ